MSLSRRGVLRIFPWNEGTFIKSQSNNQIFDTNSFSCLCFHRNEVFYTFRKHFAYICKETAGHKNEHHLTPVNKYF